MQKTLSIGLLLLCTFISVLAQSQRVEGVVTDMYGDPVIGASVVVKGHTQIGIHTDMDGRFVLSNIPEGSRQLVISYIGMATQEVAVKPNLKVTLEDDSRLLQETVVVAFGEQKKSAFTGSAAVIDSKALESKQLTNVVSALSGEAAGVQMTNSSGDPTATPELRIRGFSSISAGQDPLIIVDGSPYDGGWNNLNPADVASISVLKDAASAALYGARGANGIVMITTKKAEAGDATVSLDARWGASSRIKRDYKTIDNIGEYYETYYKALYNYQIAQGSNNATAHQWANNTLGAPSNEGGLGYLVMSVPAGEYLIGDNGRLNPHATLGNRVMNTETGQVYTLMPDNWMDEANRIGNRQEYNLNVNGGNEKMQFYASLGYLKSEGICRQSDFERYSARLKANYQANKYLRMGGNVAYTHSLSNYLTSGSNSLFAFAQQIAPIYPVYIRDAAGNILHDSNGKMYDYGDGAVNGLDRPYQPKYNPLQDALLNTYDNKENQFSINGFADVTPIEGLKLTANGAVTLQSRRFNSTGNPFYGYSKDANPGGYIYQGSDETYSLNFQQLANYKKTLGEHTLEVLLGHENYKMNYDYLWGSRKDMASYFDNQTLAGAITIGDTNSQRQDYNTEGYFFRGQYDFAERYFASVSVRRDASSRFHPDHRWGTFYSMGGAWILTKEEWLNLDWLNTLKLKASFGQVGNDAIGDFRYMDTYRIVNSDGEVALVQETVGNPDITWETLNNLNVGVEFELLRSRLRGGVEFFVKKTTDMLCFVGAPKSMGYSGSYDNIGDMLNRGVEVELSGDIIRTKNFTWTVSANATFLHNEITKIAPKLRNKKVDGHAGYYSGSYYYGEGLPLYTWYMPRYAGLSADGRSQWYVLDSDGNTTTSTSYNDATYYICGDPSPWMYGGFSTQLSWRGLSASVSFAYSLGGKAYDWGYSSLMTNPVQSSTGFSIHRDMLNAWSTDNPGSNIPRWQYGDQNTSAFSDRFLTDASHLTLSNVNIGYTLPRRWTKPLGISNLRVYTAGENLAFWTKRMGFDPRGSFQGETSTGTYSPSRSISAGLSLTF